MVITIIMKVLKMKIVIITKRNSDNTSKTTIHYRNKINDCKEMKYFYNEINHFNEIYVTNYSMIQQNITYHNTCNSNNQNDNNNTCNCIQDCII